MSRAQPASDYVSRSYSGMKNRIINGNFDVWQRGTSISVTASGTYTADRYVAYYDGTGATRTVSRQAFTVGQTAVPYEPRYFLRYAQTVAGSGAGSNAFVHKIEGARTFAGQTVTISFYAKFASTASINVIAYQAFGTGGSPSGIGQLNFVTGLSVGTTWTKYTYTAAIPSISGKTFGTNENDSLDIYFVLPINTTFTFDIAQIQLEAGSIATPFEHRPYGMELALCQRYYETAPSTLYGMVWSPATVPVFGWYFKVPKRSTTPGLIGSATSRLVGNSAIAAGGQILLAGSTTVEAQITTTITASVGVYWIDSYGASFSAEL